MEEYSDRSRAESIAAGATRKKCMYLGEWSTVMDAEMAGIAMAWEDHDIVALDSQGAIQGTADLMTATPNARIEALVRERMRGGPKKLMWVKGHSGVEGNEVAGLNARKAAWIGKRAPKIATPAGIRQAYPCIPGHATQAVKGLSILVTDKGYQRGWLT